MSAATLKVQAVRWTVAGARDRYSDTVAGEEPLEIRVADRSVAVVMRTPGEDRELAAGFLLTEGVIKSADDLLDVLVCRDQEGGASGNVVNAVVAATVAGLWAERNGTAESQHPTKPSTNRAQSLRTGRRVALGWESCILISFRSPVLM